jgi:hypothetical protein
MTTPLDGLPLPSERHSEYLADILLSHITELNFDDTKQIIMSTYKNPDKDNFVLRLLEKLTSALNDEKKNIQYLSLDYQKMTEMYSSLSEPISPRHHNFSSPRSIAQLRRNSETGRYGSPTSQCYSPRFSNTPPSPQLRSPRTPSIQNPSNSPDISSNVQIKSRDVQNTPTLSPQFIEGIIRSKPLIFSKPSSVHYYEDSNDDVFESYVHESY